MAVRKFDYTTSGCEAALKYLKESGYYHLIEHEQSTDGYTLVDLANSVYHRVLEAERDELKDFYKLLQDQIIIQAQEGYGKAMKAKTENDELRAENDRLRAALANSDQPCVYCALPADEWGKCQSGFPGCARGDDAMGCPELGASMEVTRLKEELAELDRRYDVMVDFACAEWEKDSEALKALLKRARQTVYAATLQRRIEGPGGRIESEQLMAEIDDALAGKEAE